jgi:pimeloyl-ACP methyl ester carboxylesterase
MIDEREVIARLEAASPEEMMQLLRHPTVEEERAYRAYLGDERYQRMHVMALQRATTRSTTGPHGNVVVIHGIMGGELTAFAATGRGEHIWARYLGLITGRMRALRLDETGREDADRSVQVRATGFMKRYYGELAAFFTAHWRTEGFWFDWRKDLNLAAASLEAHLARWFPPGEPVHIVAHSMGGLVARTFIKNYPARWESMWDKAGNGRRGGRLIMLGTPNHGSFAVPQIITGLEGMVQKLARFDLRHSRRQIQDIANTFVGSYQMLPSPLVMPNMLPLYESRTYGDLNVPQRHLDSAFEHHEALQKVIDPERMIYVAGYDQRTLATITDLANVGRLESYQVTMHGDGRVPHQLGALDGVTMYYVKEEHGELSTNRQVFLAAQDLIAIGTTEALPTSRPVTRDRPDPDAELDQQAELQKMQKEQEEDLELLDAFVHRSRTARSGTVPPTYVSSEERIAEEILVRGWLSARPEVGVRPSGVEVSLDPPELRLRVVGAGIEATDFLRGKDLPVDVIAVGHYHGVKPVAAELAIDRAISAARKGVRGDGSELADSDLVITQLSERGTIRGELGQPFFLPDYRDRANGDTRRLIAVAGMGLPGRFGAPELTVLVRELAWALGRMGKRHLASVLIGSGNGNLSIEDAVAGWIRGLKHALTGAPDEVQIQEVTLIEHHPGRVITIDKAIRAHQQSFETSRRMVLDYQPLTDKQKTTLRQAARTFDQAEVERRWVEERETPAEELAPTRITLTLTGNTYRFGAITANASVPEREVPLDRQLVEDANDELAAEWNPELQKERGAFLERLLIPADLRPHLTGNAPVVMMLDATTARIHWEMAAQPDTRSGPAGTAPAGAAAGALRPFEASFLGTSRGLTRQLRTTFAPPPEPPPPPQRHLRVLVVADPAADARLAGAEEEGAEVAEIFELYNTFYPRSKSRVEVVRLLGPREATRTRVLKELLLRHYDVLHFAGHCRFEQDHPERTGWIFSGDTVLSANELNRIDRIPNFVFSNACESGITPDRSEMRTAALAPSFAEAFFQRGVVNFVCTAWPIDDLSARFFALTLYGRLLGIDVQYSREQGFEFARGEMKPMHVAMREARLAIADTHAGRQSWGAYQHYGNPNFRFFAPTAVEPGDDEAAASAPVAAPTTPEQQPPAEEPEDGGGKRSKGKQGGGRSRKG